MGVSGSKKKLDAQRNCGNGLGADGAQPPAWLDAEAVGFWNRNIAAVRSPLDLDAFAILASTYGELLVEDNKRAKSELRSKFLVMCREFGLTPSSRRTLGTPSQAARHDGKGTVSDEDFEL